MKKISAFLGFVLVFALLFTSGVKSENDKKLLCNKNGDFTILVVSDPQCDTVEQWHEAQRELETLVNRSDPDFVLINGDMNSHNIIPKDMWQMFVTPLEKRNICWSTTNGNHDPFDYKHYKMFTDYNSCLNSTVSTTDINYEKDRPMNYVLPIYSNDGQKIVFMVYAMDSGTKTQDGYTGLTKKQVDWYKNKSEGFKAINNGNAITSILCMHIPLPQMLEMYYGDKKTIYGIANEINYNLKGYVTNDGKQINKINVHTSNINSDAKMFDAILNQGDIRAVFFGHNHRNNFIGSYQGILLGFVGKLSTGCYSDNICRGGRVVRFNESDPQNFTTEWLTSLKTGKDQPRINSDGKIVK